MASAFPGALDSYTTKVDLVDSVLASHINEPQSAIVAIETHILANVAGPNLLYHSLTHDIWPQGTSQPDLADDSYCAGVWNVLNSTGNPDISGQGAGATDDYTRAFRCTFDATGQCGIVQFFTADDTRKLRGTTLSLSFDAWGTSVTSLRAAVLYWTGTADALTSDVVGTWLSGGVNNTLAASWSYANTPGADITITSSQARYEVEGIAIPTSANNLAVFIWTPSSEASGDLFNVAKVKLEIGAIATPFSTPGLADEIARVQQFIYWTPDVISTIRLAMRSGTNSVVGYFFFPTTMRAVPTVFSHNITGWTGGAPGTTTVGAFNYTTAAFVTITGALTTGSTTFARESARIDFTAGTSFNGTAGSFCELYLGLDVRLYWAALL